MKTGVLGRLVRLDVLPLTSGRGRIARTDGVNVFEFW